jgi:hypothetical protein
MIEQAPRASDIGRLLDPTGPSLRAAGERQDALLQALSQVAARFAEIVTANINAAPQQHLDAMAAMIDPKPQQARAAEVVLAFRPAAGGREAVVVPQHTLAASEAAGPDGQPVVFATLADLKPVKAELVHAVLVDEGHRHATDLTRMLTAEAGAATPGPALALRRELHIAQPAAFGLAALRRIVLHIELESSPAAPEGAWQAWQALQWGVAGPKEFVAFQVESDGTHGLATSGDVVLALPADGPAWPECDWLGVASRWLTLRQEPGASAAPEPGPPRVRRLSIDAWAANELAPVQQMLSGSLPLDGSKEIMPFGERPGFGACWLLQSSAFEHPGTRVTLQVVLVNPPDSTNGLLPAVHKDAAPVLVWEISNGSGYQLLRVDDGTGGLTRSAAVSFTVPAGVAPTRIGGCELPCLRARLVNGHYGVIAKKIGSVDVETPVAPVLRAVVRTSLALTGLPAQHLVSHGALQWRRLDPALPFDLFPSAGTPGPALYLALEGADTLEPRSHRLHVHARVADPALPRVCGSPPPTRERQPTWQLMQAGVWRDIVVRDGTSGLQACGLLALELPDLSQRWPGCALDPDGRRAWLRVCWPADAGAAPGRLLGLSLNAVPARQGECLRDEIAGSGTGKPGQRLQALRVPIVGEVELRVGEGEAGWQRWREVDDLAPCGPDERVFTLDRGSGAIVFGDGRHGRIPPAGPNNIRLASYWMGGGRHGNVPRLAVKQLRTALPGVAAVFNPEAASGGLDVPDAQRLRRDAWRSLRHRHRAIGPGDYVDLALMASPEVARAYCVPPGEPAGDDGISPPLVVVLVPDSAEAMPQPGAGLLQAVKAYLDERRPPAVRLVLCGPRYLPVSVGVTVAVGKHRSGHEVAAECRRRIERFLHPLTGGGEGAGWAPGERPHRSDLFALLDQVEGVEAVHGLRLLVGAESAGPAPTLVAAGRVEVDVQE